MRHDTAKVDARGYFQIPEKLRRRYHVRPGAELVWKDPGNGTLVLNLQPKKGLEDVRAALAGDEATAEVAISTGEAIEKYMMEKHSDSCG